MSWQAKFSGFIAFVRRIQSVHHLPTSASDVRKFPKLRKSVLLLSFNGQGYKGMQKNTNIPTIEGALFEALTKAEAIPPNSDPEKLNFQRCSRTDKGVSAARLAVSLKVVYNPGLLPSINEHLPSQIRVFSMKRVTKSFHCRFYCDEREYEYVMPSYVFAGQLPLSDMLKYRIDDTSMNRVSRLLQYYVGIHNFHNFTRRKQYTDRSCRRRIKSFEVHKRFLAKSDCTTCGECKEMEFVVLRVSGSSFMLHQIRKMVGLLIGVLRGTVPEELICNAFNESKVHICRAPSLGLLLDNVRFDGYNSRWASDGSREALEWDSLSEVEEFKKKYIYQAIVDKEINELSMVEWIFGDLWSHVCVYEHFKDLDSLRTDGLSLTSNVVVSVNS